MEKDELLQVALSSMALEQQLMRNCRQKSIEHVQWQTWKISVLNFSAWMYCTDSRNVSFFLYSCDLLYKCNLIEIEQYMKTD